MKYGSGSAAVDHYVNDEYDSVYGMSSQFAAIIAAHVMNRQTKLGISGHVAEIGTFEGRFFIAMALAMQPGERAVGIDTFEWPSPKVRDKLHSHIERLGVRPADVTILTANSADLAAKDISDAVGGQVRFFHVDGDHTPKALTHDLNLAYAVMHPKGVICLDDMLHPGFPLLTVAVYEWLKTHPDMRVFCVIDREDIVAAPKFMLCRHDAHELYEKDLLESFPEWHFEAASQWEQWVAIVLTPHPRFAIVE
jgi:predicted O-methyltransferase YrrM